MLGTVCLYVAGAGPAKELDARTDLFSFGAVLYEMATGKLPFDGSSAGEICGSILHQEPRHRHRSTRRFLPELEMVIRKALEKDRNLRYQHASRHANGSATPEARQRERAYRPAAHGASRSSGRMTRRSVPTMLDGRPFTPARNDSAARPIEARQIAVRGNRDRLIAGGLYYRSHRSKPLTDKDTHRPRRFHQYHGRSCLRRHPAARAGGATGAVAFS